MESETTTLLEGLKGDLKEISANEKEIKGRLGEIEKGHKDAEEKNSKRLNDMDQVIADTKKMLDDLRRAQIAAKANQVRRPGTVSDACARHLAALAIGARLFGRPGDLDGKQKDTAEGIVREILGVETKAALTSSDIPLPTEFSGEVVELVSTFGAARRLGTVYPLGTGTVKLPRLKTDPTFGLIAQSGSVTEKSPQTEWVTFSPEKFGGLVRVPFELDADSIVPLGQFIARYAARQMAYAEDWNFFRSTGAGSGINGSVEGLCVSTITNSKKFQMGTGDMSISDSVLADFRSLRAQVDAAALGMSRYIMHPTMEQHLSGFNTAGDKPYNANGLQGASLDGFPIEWVDSMPAYTTSDSVSTVYVLFGDASYQYLGVRGTMRFDQSADAGFTTDEVLIRALERFTIGLMATGSVAGLQTAAS